MAADVFFADLHSMPNKTFLDKLSLLTKKLNFEEMLKPHFLAAIKIHFGERGNTAYVRPVYVRRLVEEIKKTGAKPFLTDANTLYVGSRGEAVSHLTTALENGFSYASVGAPLVIADGLRGHTHINVPINGKHCQEVSLGSEIVQADFICSIAHFKCHELSGFGGTIKNLGMGAASRKGKLDQHSNVAPFVKPEVCVGCGTCVKWCREGALALNENKKAAINPDKCIGCGECIITCPKEAIAIEWNESTQVFQEKMVEYTYGLLKDKKDRAVFFNFIMQVSPACDCYPFADTPIVGDIGALASLDPVALDQACADLVIKAPGNRQSCLKGEFLSPGADKFRGVFPNIDWNFQLDYAEQLGLGSRKYKIYRV